MILEKVRRAFEGGVTLDGTVEGSWRIITVVEGVWKLVHAIVEKSGQW